MSRSIQVRAASGEITGPGRTRLGETGVTIPLSQRPCQTRSRQLKVACKYLFDWKIHLDGDVQALQRSEAAFVRRASSGVRTTRRVGGIGRTGPQPTSVPGANEARFGISGTGTPNDFSIDRSSNSTPTR